MESSIEIKNVPSVIVLTHLQECDVTGLERTAYELYSDAQMTKNDSIFCLSDKPELKENNFVRVCCPIHSVDLEIDLAVRKIEVLPRALVISTIHKGEYNDLKPVFDMMRMYVEKNRLTVAVPYRIIFHREKREWDRDKPLKKPERPYVTEIQFQILDN